MLVLKSSTRFRNPFITIFIGYIVFSALPSRIRGEPVSKLKQRVVQPLIMANTSYTPMMANSNPNSQEFIQTSADSYLGRTLKQSINHGILEGKRRFGGGGNPVALDKGPPELQFGLSFTVPFVSLHTDRLVNALSGRHNTGGGGLGGFGDPYSDMGHILKLNVAGLVLAAVVGVGALLFFPALFPTKFAGLFPGLANFLPNLMDQFGLGGGGGGGGLFNKPFGFGSFGSFDNSGDYPYGAFSNQQQYRDTSGGGTGPESRARSFSGPERMTTRNNNGTFWGEVISSMQSHVKVYWNEFESCAYEAMCSRGSRDAKNPKNEKGKGKSSRRLEETHLTPLDHLLEAVQGMDKVQVLKSIPLIDKMQKSYKIGNGGDVDCSQYFSQCKLNPTQISNVINSMGDYIFKQ